MSETLCDIGVIGLGVMGANLAKNFASRGLRVAGYSRDPATAERLAAQDSGSRVVAATDMETLCALLERPRRILVMVPAGAPVDAVLDGLDPLLETDDIVIDGGNSLFTDTDRRNERAASRPWRFVGMGVSGGSEGALLGPALMPGGDPETWARLRPVLESIAAKSDSGSCVTYCGRGSAGHFVKMVHNGIEYGDMQLIAETSVLLRRGLGLAPSEVAAVFAEWNEGELESFLIEITSHIFEKEDPRRPGQPLIDAILDRAGQKGTGRWTVQAALDLGVSTPTLSAAVDARVLSAQVELRAEAEAAFAAASDGEASAVLEGVGADELRDALYASKIASYSQGFDLLATASAEYGYETDLGEVARIWKAGCIIRARFLDRVRAAHAGSAPSVLALAPDFRADLVDRVKAWRRVVSAAIAVGLPVPGLAASLSWFDSLRTARGSANVIQAQRDYFGSHTYERRDAPGEALHTDWKPKAS